MAKVLGWLDDVLADSYWQMETLVKNTLIIGCTALALITGCAYQASPDATPVLTSSAPDLGWQLPELNIPNYHSHKNIDDYSEQLALQIIENRHYTQANETVAVASFVELDSDLNKTNLLGHQLADGLMGELQQYGVSVLDFKTMDVIRVNSGGDFVFSRDHNQLREWQDIDYVLSGTLTRNNRGVVVHARMIGVKSKRVVSSANVLIPNFVLYSVYAPNFRDGIHFGD